MIFPTGKPRNNAFTLIELLLVLVILGVIAGISVPFFGGARSGLILRRSAGMAADLMRYAQTRAMLSGQAITIVFNDDGSYQLLRQDPRSGTASDKLDNIPERYGQLFSVPQGVRIISDNRSMRFDVDGSITKNRVIFSDPKHSRVISTHEQRGHILVFQGEAGS
jgi:prepilin-type N-terminal cleavage/methylation domain-containing protein